MKEFSRNVLYSLVRDFSVQTPPWGLAIRYETKPDEVYDITKAAYRVYGRMNESLVIQAAAGLDSPELPMTERTLVLPTRDQLRAMKIQAGFDADEIY